MKTQSPDSLSEAQIRLTDAEAALNVLTLLFLDASEQAPLAPHGVGMLLQHIHGDINAALDELNCALNAKH